MKRLYLLRHAKSSWGDSDIEDFERPLSPKGLRSAPRMGQYMRSLGYKPTLALCSPARRTRQTWSHIRSALGGEPVEDNRPELYHADPRTLLDLIRGVDDEHAGVIVIGHNPGILTLALGLIGNNVQTANPFGKYPTAALTVLDFEIGSWAELQPGCGHLIGFTRPKDLDTAA